MLAKLPSLLCVKTVHLAPKLSVHSDSILAIFLHLSRILEHTTA